MRRDYASSRDGLYRDRPKKAFGLAEHEYNEDVSRDQWRAMNDKARSALRAFLTSDLFATIREIPTSEWISIEKLDQFIFESTPVWVVMDFAHRTEDGIAIYDWKTARSTPKATSPSLAATRSMRRTSWASRPERVDNAIIYLGDELTPVTFQMTEDDLKSVRAFMRESIAKMRAQLTDGPKNVAVRDDFPMTDNFEHCKTCVFRRLCDRHEL